MRIRLGLLFTALLLSLTSAQAQAANCPFNVPIVTIAPHSQGGYTWGNGIRPMGDACVSRIGVDPVNDAAWYVGGINGLYMTKTNGLFWTKPFSGQVRVIYMDAAHELVYVGVANKLYVSNNQGQSWTTVGTYNAMVESVLVAGGTLYVGLAYGTHAVPSGIYRSSLTGSFPTFLPFGAGHTGLIVWSLAYDRLDGVLYAGTEIFDHQPQPYKPKFFRSANGGGNWTNVQGVMPNHVIAMAVRPSDGYLYAMNESLGVYGTSTNGSSWVPPTSPMGVGGSMLMDPFLTTRLYGGRQKSGLAVGDGGAWVSTDAGKTFTAIGLPGATVGDMVFNGTRTTLYAAAYASGVYRSPMP